ncbi:MAG: ribosome silencing factor [Candidatus Omnitrophota bacterium]
MKVARRSKVSNSKAKALLVADFAAEKKGENIVILDMRKVTNFCDFFVICSAPSDRRLRAIAEGIIDSLEERSIKIPRRINREESNWIALDLGDIIVHIFDNEIRDFYNLEHLWQDAARIAYTNKSED